MAELHSGGLELQNLLDHLQLRNQLFTLQNLKSSEALQWVKVALQLQYSRAACTPEGKESSPWMFILY